MKNIFKKIITTILQVESRLVLMRYRPKIVAITGSVGKTSTKDAIYAMLSKITYVRKSEKSYNSEIGLPLTILGIPNAWSSPTLWIKNIFTGLLLIINPFNLKYPKWLVLEVGVSHPGDMDKTAGFLKTDAVVMTAIGETPAHIEFYSSRKELIEEKRKLINTLKKNGLLILNADDKDILQMKNGRKFRTATYGFSPEVEVHGSSENIFYNENSKDNGMPKPEGVIFRADMDGSSLPVVISGVFGRNHIYAALATLALVYGLKLNAVSAIGALKNYEVPAGRMRLLSGINDTFIIDDTYNSSPFACESALKTLHEVKSTGRKIAVLGDMLELGRHTIEAHKKVGAVVKENSDILITVGPRAKAIKEGAESAGMDTESIFEFMNSLEAGEFLKTFIKPGDFILIKGSQGMRMERTVEAILLDQENKSRLLVRQDKEWKDKE
jgi:UDP-N-acetylmuramoyl-tripeptide--D-alanyl-D-alanine ligase